MNRLIIRFTGDKRQLIPLIGHGVAIFSDMRGSLDDIWDMVGRRKETGCIDIRSMTVVGKSSGCSIESGDILIHNPEICRDGIRRYND